MPPISPLPRQKDTARWLRWRQHGTSDIELPGWARVAIVLVFFVVIPVLIALIASAVG